MSLRTKANKFIGYLLVCWLALVVVVVVLMLVFRGPSEREKQVAARTATLDLALDRYSPWLRLNFLISAIGADPESTSAKGKDCAQPRHIEHFPVDCHYSYPGILVTTVLDTPLDNWRESRVIYVEVSPPFKGTIHGIHLGDLSSVPAAKANEFGASPSDNGRYGSMSWGPKLAPSGIRAAIPEWSISWMIDEHNRIGTLEMYDEAYQYVSKKP